MAGGKHNKAQNNGKKSLRKDSSSGSDPRPYNCYNLYFILERELFLQERGVYPSSNHDEAAEFHVDYSGIELPSLPSRYSSLVLSDHWYVHKKKKRAHVKTHGLVSFREMASMVASRWKQEDNEIILFLKSVADKVKQRFEQRKLSPYAVAYPSPIDVPSNQERFHIKMMNFRQVVSRSNGQPVSPIEIPSNLEIPRNQESFHITMMKFRQDMLSFQPDMLSLRNSRARSA
ncbi:hypothetical protein ACHAXR_010041 [Thalassiosira sp. AJA248-18]